MGIIEDTAVGAADPDPRVGLRAVRSLRRLGDQLETLHVQHARDAGWSWAEIAEALGTSRQAAHQKHARAMGEPRSSLARILRR